MTPSEYLVWKTISDYKVDLMPCFDLFFWDMRPPSVSCYFIDEIETYGLKKKDNDK